MSEYFIEIYGEEIPSQAQIYGEKFISNFFSEILNQKNISYDSITTFSNVKRIGCSITGIPSFRESEINLVRGPATDSNEKAILGFMKSHNIKKKNQLKNKKINEKEYFFFEKKIPKIHNLEIFRDFSFNILNNFKWKTSMRWANLSEKWIRPIKNIVCFFDGKKINLSFANIKTTDEIRCNTFYGNARFKFENFQNYNKDLEKNFVLIDRQKRIQNILNQIKKIEDRKKIKFNFDNDLLIECANFCEYPVIYEGQFDEKFFEMPEIFIQTILKEKQKYFSFSNEKKQLSNTFAFVANNKNDKKRTIREGHQNVLAARLKDALFFIKDDLSISLANRKDLLKDIIYFDGLGNLEEKVNRQLSLAKILSKELNFELLPVHEKIILMSKSDLTTEIVREFPSLQGKAGSFYALKEGFRINDCNAISEQYLPNNDNNNIPKKKFSICLSILEKTDHIVGAFLANKKPSGSKDPFATRRSAIGLIRTLIENKISVDIEKYIDLSMKHYKNQNQQIKLEILNFLETRLKNYFKELGFETKIQNAVSNGCKFNPYIFYQKITILFKKIGSNDFEKFLSSFKRLHSLLTNKNITYKIPNKNLFKQNEEKELLEEVLKFSKFIDADNLNIDYLISFNEIYKLSNPINNFLDNIIVNVENKKIKENRFTLINFCKEQIEKHTIFSEIL